MSVSFVQLNDGWNAEPNAPEQRVFVDGGVVAVRFLLNPFKFSKYQEGDEATLRFMGAERYRLGPTNDEGWRMGQCRFSKLAPAWGEFYEVFGESALLSAPSDWHVVSGTRAERHFLFYFRDETFECVAQEWSVELPANKSANTDPQLKAAASPRVLVGRLPLR
jgi:hypothetical protein